MGIAASLAPSPAASQEWEEVALYGGWPNDLFADSQDRVWAATSRGGVYRLANENAEWVRVFDDPDIDPRSVAVGTGGRAYIGTDGFNNTGFFRTTDDGASWQMINTSLSGQIVLDILPMPDNQTIWACTFDDGLHRSTNGGTTFSAVFSFPASFTSFVRANAAGHLFVGVQFNAVNLYFSSDGGASWQARDTGLTSDPYSVFVDPATGNLYAADATNVYESTNDGLTWTSLAAPPGAYLDVAVFQGRIYAAQYNGSATGARIYSTDVETASSRANWTLEVGVPVQSFRSLVSTSNGLYLGVQGPGPYRRDSTGWEPMVGGMRNVFIDGIVADESNGFAYVAAENIGIFRSPDMIDWTLVGNGIRGEYIYSMAVAPNGDLYASGASSGTFKSTDDGENFTNVFSEAFTALAANDWGYVFGGIGSRIYRSPDDGTTWPLVANLAAVNGISDIECTGNDVYVATGYFDFGGQGVYRSTNWGSSFSAFNTGLGNLTVRDIGIDPDAGGGTCGISAATSSGIYDLADLAWNLNAAYSFGNVKQLLVTGGRWIAREEDRLRYASPAVCGLTIDDWSDLPEPDPSRYYGEFGGFRLVQSPLRGEGEYFDLLGTLGDGLYRMGDGPTTGTADVPPSSTSVRLDVLRSPFVRSTTLEFEIPKAGVATVGIFDVAGRKVMSLADGWTAAGRHSLSWDADGLAAGVYFARLSTELASVTQRVVLLR
jgi:photosystem II stability/assembly factor-like uncharacterized protein